MVTFTSTRPAFVPTQELERAINDKFGKLKVHLQSTEHPKEATRIYRQVIRWRGEAIKNRDTALEALKGSPEGSDKRSSVSGEEYEVHEEYRRKLDSILHRFTQSARALNL